VADELHSLRANSTPWICEGRSSPAESTCAQPLWRTWLARASDLPVILSATSTAAGLLAPLRYSRVFCTPTNQRLVAGILWFTSAPTRRCCQPGSTTAEPQGRPPTASFRTPTDCGSTPRISVRCARTRVVGDSATARLRLAAGGRDSAAAHLQLHRCRALASSPGCWCCGWTDPADLARATWGDSRQQGDRAYLGGCANATSAEGITAMRRASRCSHLRGFQSPARGSRRVES